MQFETLKYPKVIPHTPENLKSKYTPKGKHDAWKSTFSGYLLSERLVLTVYASSGGEKTTRSRRTPNYKLDPKTPILGQPGNKKKHSLKNL